MRRRWQDRVVLDPAIHHGDPCIKGTRIPVAILVGSLADGLTFDDILQAYPQLTREDLFAALACGRSDAPGDRLPAFRIITICLSTSHAN